MATPFYVAPEQMMQDRAEYARKGIARGRSLAAVSWEHGVLFVSENPSRLLSKTSEIYDRIAFGAVGKYNEFESLRVAGIRMADVKGYQYAREDVTAKSLATAYSQSLGAIFMGDGKPYEVELLIAQVNGASTPVELFHILYDGSIVDEADVVAIGGDAEAITTRLREQWTPGLDLGGAVRLAVHALAGATERDPGAPDLEVSGLDRTRGRRQFFRLDEDRLADLLARE
ncbi:proteasome subunit alpha [Salsipaludibacter albus]|jgi:proteasome alpha subunit|uniref:proteasome subunit alpha n=1 Tax=Salsipaludibacter albus TaxID=2849650 RepID=UPI001EE438D4|nr:proteasome subunit alpha [Salsipaludibacter albus]MBY5161657.1 proteasome subunit alpha [Salsipaludibacter albus]